jgi:hypothetical protein
MQIPQYVLSFAFANGEGGDQQQEQGADDSGKPSKDEDDGIEVGRGHAVKATNRLEYNGGVLTEHAAVGSDVTAIFPAAAPPEDARPAPPKICRTGHLVFVAAG